MRSKSDVCHFVIMNRAMFIMFIYAEGMYIKNTIEIQRGSRDSRLLTDVFRNLLAVVLSTLLEIKYLCMYI